jgi:hypothetical protein
MHHLNDGMDVLDLRLLRLQLYFPSKILSPEMELRCRRQWSFVAICQAAVPDAILRMLTCPHGGIVVIAGTGSS